MDARKNRTPALPDPSGWPSLFLRQPPRVLIVEALPPWWSQTGPVLCEALDNFLSLACSVAGPCRVPLLSLYAVSRQQECLLPVVTSQPGRGVVRRLEAGLRGVDLVSLRRLLVLEISTAAGDWGRVSGSPEDKSSAEEESLMLGTEMDLQRVDNSTVAVETVLKSWLQAQGGDREQLNLVLPGGADRDSPVYIKCDVQERLLSPALLPLTLNIGPKTESAGDLPPPAKGSADQNPPPPRLTAVKTLRMEGVCESVMYGLPMVLRPTSCWQLDWDELESNHDLFHALCHTLRSRDLFLLVRSDTARSPAAPRPGLQAHYVLQASPFSSLLLKPVVSRELLLPCPLPTSAQDPRPDTLHAIQGSLAQLDEDSVFNPLSVTSNLYQHLKNRALLSRPKYPYRVPQAARRDQPLPPEGAKASHMRPPRQQGHLGPPPTHKVRATVAPLPSSSSFASCQGPPPSKASRPALTFLSSGGRAPRAPPVSYTEEERDPEEEEDFLMPL